MSLQAIVDAVTPLLPAGTTIVLGAENLRAQSAPRRVALVPVNDTFGDPQTRGSASGDARALHTCHAALEAHCWGNGLDDAVALRDSFILALRTIASANYRLTGGRWVGQDLVAVGRVYVLAFTLDIPITDAAPTRATPTSAPQDVAFSH